MSIARPASSVAADVNESEAQPQSPSDEAAAAGDQHAQRQRGLIVAAAIVCVVLAIDQATKAWAVAALSDGPVNIIGTTVQFVLVRNPGSAFSLIQGFTPLLAVIAIGIAVILVRMLRRASDPMLIVALSLVLAGALGNLIDRLVRSPGFLRGHVVDFVKVSVWPVFNVADAALTVGVILLLWWSWRRD